ncbi:MAG: hypothetical protein H6741_14220 [Alphaproteobacteria bacterium]|nr:hypothetical protein [Alphaproteobacteria bacterium]
MLLLGDQEFHGGAQDPTPTLAGQLTARLREAEAPGRVIDATVPGHSILQTRAWMDQEGWALEPALLVLTPGLSDCAPSPLPDAELLACLDTPAQRLRWAWSVPPGAEDLPRITEGDGAALEALGCPAEPSAHRVPAEPYAEALDGLLLDAAQREVGVVILLSDAARSADCPHRALTQRVGTRRAVPVLDLAEVNRSAGSWGRGAREDDGSPSQNAITAAAQALVDVLGQSGWPEHRLTPEIAAPPYSVSDARRNSPGGIKILPES